MRPRASPVRAWVSGSRQNEESLPSFGRVALIFKRYAGTGSAGITAPHSPDTITTLASRRLRCAAVNEPWSSASYRTPV